MKHNITNRGFSIYDFLDRNGNHCSVQNSSLVDPSIWLGMDSDDEGNPVGKEFEGKRLGARMHLTREQVSELLPLLNHFATYGHLPTGEEQPQDELTIGESEEKRLIKSYRKDDYPDMLRIIADDIQYLIE